MFYLTENWKSVDNNLVKFPSPLAPFLLRHDVHNIRTANLNCNPSKFTITVLYL